MASTEGGATKEATILERSHELIKTADDLNQRLENRFSRNPAVGKDSGEKPQSPNVLDEIIDNLGIAIQRFNGIITFIANEVLPKIS